ncbi:D-serine ammonia-lyase [Allofournierella massiliensis]|uniref:Probable D-serine dehydratase n=1 Tax=Allofournierella massiliensis TaxID=1650663 RepID=A0A4R1QUE9_9FIRM|nr:D-serine ammonia-lyase [Fournierella massiliensis]TCL54554.1 D-serine ammonia-lyase [Fournierella massiliensis]
MYDPNRFIESDPAIRRVAAGEPTVWINPDYLPVEVTDGLCQLVVPDSAIDDAEARLARFASFIRRRFPETEPTNGLIESPLADIPRMQQALEKEYGCTIPGRLMLKMDSHLAIAGSVKARGGIYEVLKHAEDLAIAAGKLTMEDDYARLDSEEMRDFFRQYTVQVGSTGNLGMSIGIMSAALGFRVKVHMSADAKQWKKDLLRSHGVEVLEYSGDYSKAVAEGRALSDTDPMSYFVDDEKSVDLFLGYAVAARRLKKQLDEQGIAVDEAHPLIVYLPTGVGGAPGGVTYGLKRLFKNNVHCFLVEPTLCPSVLLGMATKQYEKANVRDFGLSGRTHADGLACASPSSFVTRVLGNLASGDFTVTDAKLYDYLRLLDSSEGKRIEPSSCAAFVGPCQLLTLEDSRRYCAEQGLTEEALANSVQIAWATGGRLVPAEVWEQYLATHLD